MKKYYIYKSKAQPITSTPEPTRRYATGEAIPESLPESYQPSQNCGNCAAYDVEAGMCMMYNAPVESNFWCANWTKPVEVTYER